MQELAEILAPYLGLSTKNLTLILAILSLTGSLIITAIFTALPILSYFRRYIPDNITYSLNTLDMSDPEKPVLKVRSMVNLPRDEVIPDNFALNLKIIWAQMRCTEQDMFVRLSAHDTRIVMPSIISTFSSIFAEAFAAEQAGLPVTKKNFFLAVTFESFDRNNPNKLHVMVVSEDAVDQFCDSCLVEIITPENPKHKHRPRTLCRMAEIKRKEAEYDTEESERIVRVVEAAFRT